MTFWKPLIKLVLIGWAKKLICSTQATVISEAIDATATMTDEEQTTYCETGIDQYVDNMFYKGKIANKPNDFSWSWNPSMDFE